MIAIPAPRLTMHAMLGRPWRIDRDRLAALHSIELSLPVQSVRVHETHQMAPGNHEPRWQVMVAGKWRPVQQLVGQPPHVWIGKRWVRLDTE